MIPCQRHLFNLPDDVAYFNCAYMSPLMNEVVAVGRESVGRKARPWTISPADFFPTLEEARGLFARLVGGTTDDIASIPAASYGIAVAAANVPVAKGQRIVVMQDQFPSNVYHWRELAAENGAEVATVSKPTQGGWTQALVDAIDERTAVVATANCHWTDGAIIDLVEVGARAREVGAALVLDLTQSLGALPFDAGEVQPDFAISACYKWLLGPYSLGFVYVAPKHHDGRPIEHNWMARRGSEDFARLVDYQDDFQPGARRFDVGESANFALMGMAVAAMRQLLEWGPAKIQATIAETTRRIADEAAALGLVASDPAGRAGHFLGLRFPGGPPDGILEKLRADNVHLSIRGDSMRVTPHVYNNEADVERLLAALRRAL